MRTFDYLHLPHNLFDGKAGDANVRLYEDRGKLEALKLTRADDLAALSERARFDNVDASTRVEGLYVGAERTRELLAGAQPADETEAQIVGYSKALALVEERSDGLDLSTATILSLYEALYGHRNLGR